MTSKLLSWFRESRSKLLKRDKTRWKEHIWKSKQSLMSNWTYQLLKAILTRKIRQSLSQHHKTFSHNKEALLQIGGVVDLTDVTK